MRKKRLHIHQQKQIIEGLCLIFQNGPETLEQAKKIISDIYKISHLNGGCQNPHQDWHDEGFVLIDALDKQGIIRVDKEEWRK